MAREPVTWTLDGFLHYFKQVHDTMLDHQFSWIIGAGASRSAGIPTGADLVDWWLREMHLRECHDGTPLENWATAERLGIDGFSYQDASASYPAIYERRFRGFPEEGFAYLEYVMTGNAKTRSEKGFVEVKPPKVIEPGPGYSILAKILEKERHRVVITTNFDNLVADALQIYTDAHPLVCGHEALAGFVNVTMRRPVICKIHRDLFLAPLNDPRKLRLLHESWLVTLRTLVGTYTPIVIGYGGNDDSLMERLNSLEPSEIKGRLIWCYFQGRDGKHRPSKRIRELVGELNGVLVPVPGFEQLMILLGARLGITVQYEELKERQDQRAERYKQTVLDLPTDDLAELKPALSSIYHSVWWWWEDQVDEQTDPASKDAIYRKAIQYCPRSVELMGNFANFLRNVRKDYDEAERLYRRALELDPDHANNTGNFASFLHTVRTNYDEAERLYRRALDLDPDDAHHTGNYAGFLRTVRTNYDEAERLYRRALDLDPDDVDHTGNFASFLHTVRTNYDEAERLYRRALDLDPDNANHTGNFASFLHTVRTNYDEAERLCRRALELDPDHASNTGNYVRLLLAQMRVGQAIPLLARAFELNDGAPTDLLAELLIYQAAMEGFQKSSSEATYTRLRELLRNGFERGHWSFDPVYEGLGPHLDPETLAVLRAYGDAVLDATKAATLDQTLAEIRTTFATQQQPPRMPVKKRPRTKS